MTATIDDAAAIDALVVDTAAPTRAAAAPVEAIPVEALLVDTAVDLAVDAAVDPVVVDAGGGAGAAAAVAPEPIEEAEPEPAVGGETRRHLHVAPDSYRRRRRVRIAAAVATVTISATLFAVVGFNVELAQNQIELQTLQDKLQHEQRRYYDLRLEVAQRSSPDQIIPMAQRLGLVETSPTPLFAEVKPAPQDPTGAAATQAEVTAKTGGSLEPNG